MGTLGKIWLAKQKVMSRRLKKKEMIACCNCKHRKGSIIDEPKFGPCLKCDIDKHSKFETVK